MEQQHTIPPFDTSILGRLLEPVGHCLTPEGARELVNLKADAVVQARLEELADKCTEGELSAEEKHEYEIYVRALEFIGVLQAHARRKFRTASP
jgi:hypothetical protein